MPDFEALIRHQQNQQSFPNERLKLVESSSEDTTNKTSTSQPNVIWFSALVGGIIGSFLGTSFLFFAIGKGLINIDLLMQLVTDLYK